MGAETSFRERLRLCPRPLWRWALFCVALRVFLRTNGMVGGGLVVWCVLPAWLGEEASS